MVKAASSSSFEALLRPDACQVFLFTCPATLPFSIGSHPWFVVNRKGALSRFEIFWRPIDRPGRERWGHLHKDFYAPTEGIAKYFFSEKYLWNGGRLRMVIEGEAAERLADVIESSPRTYPYRDRYSLRGPNSNTYGQWVLDQVPEAKAALPWNSFGSGWKEGGKGKGKIVRRSLAAAAIILAVFGAWQGLKRPPADADWQPQLAVASHAEFDGDSVTVRNVRDFRYAPTEKDMHPAHYDRTYDLSRIARVWYIAEPFNEMKVAAHTFLSFEFENGDFLAITIEARKTKDQEYSVWKGLLRTYPIVYIATDERDAVLLRANVREDDVYVYPVRLARPENARALLVDMLERMNDLRERPEWYHTLWRNCTSEIAYHVNRVSPGRVPAWSWQFFLTSSADELALERGLLDTDLAIEEARRRYLITPRSKEAGDVPEYSQLIRAGN